ncbi:LOW QUALITY PROTEIN: uncharacterized protein ACR2FA_004791 [Aphomia sociella]
MQFHYILLFAFTFVILGQGQDVSEQTTTDSLELEAGEKKMSDSLLEILEHYKKPDPVGLPGAKVPDPYSVPDMKQSLAFGTVLYFKNTAVYGISKFRIVYINAEIAAMEVQAIMTIDKLQARGNYTLSTWVNRAQGPFTVDVGGLKIKARANLGVERDGKLRAQNMNIDIGFSTIAVNFQNLGVLGSIFQGFINSVGPFVFDSIKPYILKEAYTKMRAEINNKLDDVAGDMQFPNSISPLDMIIAEARKIREMEMDPYKIKDYNTTMSIFSVTLSRTWVTGISSFERVGNITLKLENNTIIADFEIGTQKLEGMTQWDITAVGGVMSRAGTASFSVEYISARMILAQPLDTRNRPQFRGLDLEVGNIQVRCDGAGTIDYIIEAAINILPNLLRYQIMDAIEGPLKDKIQQELDKINVEETIKQELYKVDEMQEQGFKLSNLKTNDVQEEQYEDVEDDFFNF